MTPATPIRWLVLILLGAHAGACRPPGAAPAPRPEPEREPTAPADPRDDLRGVPPELAVGLASCEVTLALATDATSGLRSVRLWVLGAGGGAGGGAYERWPDGTLRVAGAQLRPRYMGRVLSRLGRAGFFERAAGGAGETGPEGLALELQVSVDDGGGGRTRWAERAPLDESALELLWDLAVELHENPDVEAYARLSALYNRAVEAFEGAPP